MKTLAIDSTPYDAGTLWTMSQSNKRARCALIAWPAGWELRVVVDGRTFWSQRCARAADAFSLAEAWKREMVDLDWTPIVPPVPAILLPCGHSPVSSALHRRTLD